MSHSLAPSEISRKLNAGNYGRTATDGQIGLFLKRESRDPWTADLVEIFKEGGRDPRTADTVGIFKGEEEIHGPPIRSKFLKGDEGSTDRPFGLNF